jgi:hypothetical protein
MYCIEKFVHAENADIFVLCNSVEDVSKALKTYKAPNSRYGLDWTKKERESLVEIK